MIKEMSLIVFTVMQVEETKKNTETPNVSLLARYLCDYEVLANLTFSAIKVDLAVVYTIRCQSHVWPVLFCDLLMT